MAIGVGTRLGTYEITGDLGAGGMGEVYRATDTDLKREVAIKILPPVFASDADRIARFQREAEALAALNHPNIAQIYGLERSGETTALAMELVEGPTLADRIAEGPIPTDESLTIAMQIADALEAAHEQNIVHRDLKPANVKIKSDGTVKVLDFGIATAPESAVVTSGQRSPTLLTPALTEAGVLLGTAAYMSPEQARGRTVDRRADIWAFGCVLYEMLTGQPAFGGEDVTTTLARVLEREANTTALPATLPSAVRHTIAMCLEKDLKKRIADIHDVKLALEGAFESGSGDTASHETSAQPVWRRALPVSAALAAGALLAGGLTWSLTRPAPPAPVSVPRFDMTPEGGLKVMSVSRSAVISPDGQSIAYLAGTAAGAAKELRLRRLDQLGSKTLAVADAGTSIVTVFFSPDSKQVGFYTSASVSNALLKRVSVQGGPASTITKLPANLRGASWGADGTIIYGTADTASGLWRVPATGGTPEMLTKPDSKSGVLYHWWPDILPGGKAVLFTMVGASERDSKIGVLSLTTGKQRVLLRDGLSPHYSPTGHLLFGRAGTLYAVRFDAARLQVEGDPVPVQQDVLTKGIGATEASLAANGTLVYLSGTRPTAGRRLVWLDRDGREEPLGAPPRAYAYASISPDGTRIALDIRDEENDIWIWDLERKTLQRLTFDPGLNRGTVWSPDGRRVAFSRQIKGHEEIYWQAADGSGMPEPLTAGSPVPEFPQDITPDGTALLYEPAVGSEDIWIAPIGRPPSRGMPLLHSPADEENAKVSPDGHWLAYESDESGRLEVYVRPFPALDSGRWQISTGGGTRPHWSRDGRELFYYVEDEAPDTNTPTATIMAVSIDTTSGFKAGTPKVLFKGPYVAPRSGGDIFDVAPDGRRFLMIENAKVKGAQPKMIIVQNWFEQLKRLVPTK